jgi:hypothetical protein
MRLGLRESKTGPLSGICKATFRFLDGPLARNNRVQPHMMNRRARSVPAGPTSLLMTPIG